MSLLLLDNSPAPKNQNVAPLAKASSFDLYTIVANALSLSVALSWRDLWLSAVVHRDSMHIIARNFLGTLLLTMMMVVLTMAHSWGKTGSRVITVIGAIMLGIAIIGGIADAVYCAGASHTTFCGGSTVNPL